MSLLLKKAKQDNSSVQSRETLQLKDNYAKLVLICLGGVAFTLLLQGLSLLFLFFLAQKPPPSLVQLTDGQSLTVTGVDHLDRTDAVITQFVNELMLTTFTWNGQMPSPTEPGQWIKDEGVSITDVQSKQVLGKVPTPVWQGTYAFDLNFREKFLQEIVKLIPQSIFSLKTAVSYVPLKILPPYPLEKGRWKVTVFSNLLFTTGIGNVEEIIPYNVDIYVRAVVPGRPDLIEQLNPEQPQNLAVSQMIQQIRQSGLEIEAIIPYKPKNL